MSVISRALSPVFGFEWWHDPQSPKLQVLRSRGGLLLRARMIPGIRGITVAPHHAGFLPGLRD